MILVPFTSMEINLYSSAPLLLLGILGILILLLDAFSRIRLVGKDRHKEMPAETSEGYVVAPPGSRFYLMPLSVLGLLSVLCVIVWQWFRLGVDPHQSSVLIYKGMLIVDRFGLFASGLCVVIAILSIMTLPAFFKNRFESGEAYVLIFFSLVGMMILIMAHDWVAMFLGIETLSLGVYVLSGLWRKSEKSSEAALKYFLVGAFVSAILLYGIALMYGATGSTQLVSKVVLHSGLWSIGALLVMGSIAFKIAAVPFHMWAPDTYEGAPAPITGFMMTAVKTAAFAFLIRFFVMALNTEPMQSQMVSILYLLSAASMILGNLGALRQENIKRMLAYSSIAHAGYLLVGVILIRNSAQDGVGVLLYYLLFYGITSVGTMAVVTWVGMGHRYEERANLTQWEGLAKSHPKAVLCMTVLLLSLGGFPPMAGFLAKFYLLKSAFPDKTLWPLLFLLIGMSLVSVAYYLRIITAMYFRPMSKEHQNSQPEARSLSLLIAVVITVVSTLGLGMLPNRFFQSVFSATIGSASQKNG